jgi:hypothetical protein
MEINLKDKTLYFEYFKHVLTFRGRNVFDVEHSIEQYNNRVGVSISVWEDTVKKGIDKIINQYNDNSDNYIIRNKKYNFGIQLHWRPDFKSGDNYNHGFTATTLGFNELNYYTKNDKEIFVEQLNRYKKGSYEKSYLRLKHIDKDMQKLNYNIFIECDKIYHEYEIIDVGEKEMLKCYDYLLEFKVSDPSKFREVLSDVKEKIEKAIGAKLIQFETITFRKIRNTDLIGSRFYINNIESKKSIRLNWTPDLELHSIDVWLTKDPKPNYTIDVLGKDLDDVIDSIDKLLEGQITNMVKLSSDDEEEEILISDDYNVFEKYRRKIKHYLKDSISVDNEPNIKRVKTDSFDYDINYYWKLELKNGVEIELKRKNSELIYMSILNYGKTGRDQFTYELPKEWLRVRDKLVYINKIINK